eukprot:GFUD01016511.1.p1 GENE.GFUD01016511.1~~GFUD01016511.1.p1  ORF type:complete len:110 (+),score=27.03 GFUD01016511.1:22-330(+)
MSNIALLLILCTGLGLVRSFPQQYYHRAVTPCAQQEPPCQNCKPGELYGAVYHTSCNGRREYKARQCCLSGLSGLSSVGIHETQLNYEDFIPMPGTANGFGR